MRSVRVLAALAAAVACCTAAPTALKSSADIVKAFNDDGYDVVKNVTYGGRRGFTAASRNVTVLSTGAHKVVHYVEGDAYSMGYLAGLLTETGASAMVTTYIDHFIVSLISFKLDEKLSSSPVWSGLYDLFVEFLGHFLTSHATAAWNADLPKGVFPPELVTEMHGLLAGCQAANPHTNVTMDRLITLNFGMDWLSANLFAGDLHNLLLRHAARTSPDLLLALSTLEPGDVDLPAFCDAFAVSGPATASGSGSFFARDFQLATAMVFQDVQTMIVFNPTDGRRPLVGAMAPGMVGAMTAMNVDGVAMGVDTLRSNAGTPDSPGLNSLLLVRSSVHNASTTAQLADVVAHAKRGCPFLYPASDAEGNGIVMEAAAYNASSTPPAAKDVSKDLAGLLPTHAFVQQHSKPDYRYGLYVRHMGDEVAPEFLDFNPQLFAHAGVPYSPANVTAATGFFFANFSEENNVWSKLHSSYFNPTRSSAHHIIVSNFATTPQLRLTQMNLWSGLFPGESMTWRFDTLNTLIHKQWGKFDFDMTKDVISFLSPDRTPGYWHDYLNASDPMSAKVQGIVCAADLQAAHFSTKGGYWADGWLDLHLKAYV